MALSDTARRIVSWRRDHVLFVRENFGVDPDDWQIRALEELSKPETLRIAMKASKGVGKSALLAWAIWIFLSCYGERGHHPKGVATSISKDNLNDCLWTELSQWYGRSKFLQREFNITASRIKNRHFPDTWYFSKRAWPKEGSREDQAKTLAGLHAKYLMFVLDESSGIPNAVMEAVDAVFSTLGHGHRIKVLQAGNPLKREGPLWDACEGEKKHLWKTIEINGDPDNPNRCKRINEEWARQTISLHGRDDPIVMVNILGQFPKQGVDALLSEDEVDAAMNRELKEDEFDFSQKRLGIDVALEGDDSTVIIPRQGLYVFNPVELRNARTNEIASRVIASKSKWGSETEYIDNTGGFGAGVIDSMTQAGYSPIGIHFSSSADNSAIYYNKRAEMWIRMRDAIKSGAALPNIKQLKKELTNIYYGFQNGRIKIEDKKLVKNRLGFSPDYADALALTYAHQECNSINQEYAQNINHIKSEYNPYD